jgi:hypothetical protein
VTKAKLEQEIRVVISRYHEHQKRRQSLPPLPDFPSESELQQAYLQWLQNRRNEEMEWMKPFQGERRLARFRPDASKD